MTQQSYADSKTREIPYLRYIAVPEKCYYILTVLSIARKVEQFNVLLTKDYNYSLSDKNGVDEADKNKAIANYQTRAAWLGNQKDK